MSIAGGTTTPPGDEGTPRLAVRVATKPPPLKRKTAQPKSARSPRAAGNERADGQSEQTTAWARATRAQAKFAAARLQLTLEAARLQVRVQEAGTIHEPRSSNEAKALH